MLTKAEEELLPKQQELAQLKMAFQTNLKLEIDTTSKKIAQEYGLDLVVNKEVLFYGGFDITNLIIERLKSIILKLQEIASTIGATLIGDPHLTVSTFKSLGEASSSDLSLVLEDKYIQKSVKSKALAFITHKKIDTIEHQLVCSNPRKALALTIKLFYDNYNIPTSNSSTPIHNSAIIKTTAIGAYVSVGENSMISENVHIMNHVYIGRNCKWKNCLIYPNTSILDGTEIEITALFTVGSVIGSDGFSYAKDNNTHIKVPHIGNVVIEANVEIGANVCIDRACLDKTIIKQGTKLDNLVHISHNCEIGRKHSNCCYKQGDRGQQNWR